MAAQRGVAILQRGRSHGGQVIVITQSAADIDALTGQPGPAREPDRQLRRRSSRTARPRPESRDWLAKLMGTRSLWQTTSQTGAHGHTHTGRGSARRVREFRISSDTFGALDRGEAVIYTPVAGQPARASILPVPPPRPAARADRPGRTRAPRARSPSTPSRRLPGKPARPTPIAQRHRPRQARVIRRPHSYRHMTTAMTQIHDNSDSGPGASAHREYARRQHSPAPTRQSPLRAGRLTRRGAGRRTAQRPRVAPRRRGRSRDRPRAQLPPASHRRRPDARPARPRPRAREHRPHRDHQLGQARSPQPGWSALGLADQAAEPVVEVHGYAEVDQPGARVVGRGSPLRRPAGSALLARSLASARWCLARPASSSGIRGGSGTRLRPRRRPRAGRPRSDLAAGERPARSPSRGSVFAARTASAAPNSSPQLPQQMTR